MLTVESVEGQAILDDLLADHFRRVVVHVCTRSVRCVQESSSATLKLGLHFTEDELQPFRIELAGTGFDVRIHMRPRLDGFADFCSAVTITQLTSIIHLFKH